MFYIYHEYQSLQLQLLVLFVLSLELIVLLVYLVFSQLLVVLELQLMAFFGALLTKRSEAFVISHDKYT